MVSVIMPAYNAEPYLEEAVESVRQQTYREWELLIIDDGSTDKTAQLALQYEQMDERIHYLKNPQNLGVAETRNAGVRHARGEWIAFLDSDDCWDPKKLENQLTVAEREQCPFLFTGSAFMNAEGQRMDYILHVPEHIGLQELAKQNVISCSSVLIQKTWMELYPMKGRQIHEDFVVWLKLLKEPKLQARGIDQPLLIYRLSAASKSGNKWKAAAMNWNVYREVGFSLIWRCYYQMCYICRNIRKYVAIYKSRRRLE